GQGAALLVEHDAYPDQGAAHPGRLHGPRGLLPFDAEPGEEVGAGRAVLGQLLVAVRSVVADGRGVDEGPGPAVAAAGVAQQGLGDVQGAAHAAVEEQPLELRAPAAVEEVLA